MSEFKLPEIKTKEDLFKLLKYLQEQGFGYFSDWEYHYKKVDKIINDANKMSISYDKKLKEQLSKMSDYDQIKKEVEAYFSKFSSEDKIMELLNDFYLVSDDSVRIPYSRPDAKDVIEWVKFKKKYNLKDDFIPGGYISYYNLDKNYLKINYGEYKNYYFKQLYKYIFNEEALDWNDKKAGEWFNIGKIEIKLFVNGKIQIKGDIDKFKEYYNKQLYKKHYMSHNDIIKYNNKVTILKAEERF